MFADNSQTRPVGLCRVLYNLFYSSELLSISDEDLLLRGITTEATERIFSLKRAALRLQAKYGSLEVLEQRIKLEGVSPDDHTLYTDLLEWRAIRQELTELVSLLEMV